MAVSSCADEGPELYCETLRAGGVPPVSYHPAPATQKIKHGPAENLSLHSRRKPGRQDDSRYVFSPPLVSVGGGVGVTGLQTVEARGAPAAGLTSVFFGFFFSRPLLSRLPIVFSSH